MTTLAVLRSAHSVVSTEATTIGGWLIWTAMKMAPATAAAAPAALVRPAAVTFMTGSWFWLPGGSGDIQDARRRVGEPTSHEDVTGMVISAPAMALGPTGYGRPSSPARLTAARRIVATPCST